LHLKPILAIRKADSLKFIFESAANALCV